ncbi:MAG: FmdB family zinc ribbon protein [Gammaproteobacteria bacterium]
MPIYEYRCTSCGNAASELEKIGAARVKKCPACGRRTFSRLVSAAAFRLKGGGWYETDFKNKGKPAAKADSGGKDGDGAKTPPAKKESKESASKDSQKSPAAKSKSPAK